MRQYIGYLQNCIICSIFRFRSLRLESLCGIYWCKFEGYVAWDYQVIKKMRIFINLPNEGESRNIRVNISNCPTTSALISEICKQLNTKKSYIIITLKYQPYNLRVLEGWPISHYPIGHGSVFLIQFNQKYKSQDLSESTEALYKVQQQIDQCLSDREKKGQSSFISSKSEKDDQYLQDCLKRMLQAVLEGNLQKIANILKEQPEIQDPNELNDILARKHTFLLNELGQKGCNALHQAIKSSNLDIVSFLLIKGTNPTLITLDSYTPLQLSVIYSSPQITKMLLEQNLTDINQLTTHGTALHLAAVGQDKKCLEILLMNEADTEMVNKQGKKAIQICCNEDMRQLLQKKIDMVKTAIPSISKGNICRVSSFTKRNKDRIMMLNPFKQELIIETLEHQVEDKIKLGSMGGVEEIVERSWLMSSDLYYFNILLKDHEEDTIMVALKHEKTYVRWIKSFRNSLRYIQNTVFNKPVPHNEQTIEIIDDLKNQIILHKRKVADPKPMSMSIMNLRLSTNNRQPNYFINIIKPGQSQTQISTPIKKNLHSMQSTIVLGSIIKSDNGSSLLKSDKASILKSQSGSLRSSNEEYSDVFEETFLDSNQGSSNLCLDGSPSYKFRKNSQKIQYISQFKKQQKLVISFRDFQIIKLLGNGAFGKVYLARYLKTNRIYALKVLNKKKLMTKKQLKYAVSEANILKKVDCPFIIKLYYAFQTPLHLYMALDNCTNGDLSEVIIVKERLSQHTARFVISQLVLAIEYLHSKQIMYRDMKPENILIASDGYIRLTDFGLSKENHFSMSFCGSPAYLSPEMLEKKGVGLESDIYGIGTVLFEMMMGDPPFFDDDMNIMFENIKNGKLRYPSYLSIQAKSLISKLLERDPVKRLGYRDINDIKKHDFFKSLDWGKIARKELSVPQELYINEQDAHTFEPVYLQQHEKITIDDTDYDEQTGSSMMSRVKHFTFARETAPPLKENIQTNAY